MYGTLGGSAFFAKFTPYAPNSPYAATKANADYLVRAYHTTFGNVGASNERPNLEVVDLICRTLDKLVPVHENRALAGRHLPNYAALKTFVPDRPGHDRRYAIDASRIRAELG